MCLTGYSECRESNPAQAMIQNDETHTRDQRPTGQKVWVSVYPGLLGSQKPYDLFQDVTVLSEYREIKNGLC